jgi:hypothetical protein
VGNQTIIRVGQASRIKVIGLAEMAAVMPAAHSIRSFATAVRLPELYLENDS